MVNKGLSKIDQLEDSVHILIWNPTEDDLDILLIAVMMEEEVLQISAVEDEDRFVCGEAEASVQEDGQVSGGAVSGLEQLIEAARDELGEFCVLKLE